MSVTVDINDQTMFAALRAFLLSILPAGVEVVQGFDNRVGMPKGAFVSMYSLGQERLSTNIHHWETDTPVTQTIEAPTKYTVQCDFYGSLSQTWANLMQTLFRDEYAVSMFPSNIVPLYADDPVQIPLINGEAQYEQRWKSNVLIQFNPVTTVTQQFADTLNVGLIEIDTTYHP